MNTSSLSAISHAIFSDILAIRHARPLIHNITNFVVMNVTANALLAIGASPLMAHAIDELPDLIAISNALVINIGTLDERWINSFTIAAMAASEKNIPIIIDPVGAGASPLRTQTVLDLLHHAKISVIRGNASEIKALDQQAIISKGVDSIDKSIDAINAAKNISNTFNCVVVISGETDYCVDKNTVISVQNGSPMMTAVTGMGCIATSIIGAFLAINKNALNASCYAMACMGMCGESAAMQSKGPGSFLPNFLDALYQIDLNTLTEKIRVSDYA